MRPDDDDVAAVVQAFSFELLGPSGSVVADLGSVAGPPPRSSLDLIHDAPNVGNSRIDWTTGGVSSPWNATRIMGPDASGQPSDPSQNAGITNGSLILAESETSFPDAVAAGIRAGAPIVEDGLTGGSAGLPAAEVRVRRNAAGASGRMAAYNAPGSSGATVEAIPGLARLQAFSPGNGSPTVDVLPPNVDLRPASNGRVQVNGSNTWQLNGAAAVALPGSAGPAFRSFLGMSIAANCEAGDLVEFTMNVRVICIAVGGAFVGEIQVFGPGGNVISPQRIVATNWALNHDGTISGVWQYVCALGTGGYTFAPVGGATGGAWTMVAPDTWSTLKRFSMRGFQ